MTTRFMRLAVMVGAIAIVSCGGGSHGGGTGRLSLTVKWPKPTKLIPAASTSIKAVLTRGTTTLGTPVTLVRPSQPPWDTTVTFSDISVGDVVLTATAFPNMDATGVAQATGAAPASIVSGQTTAVTVTMDTTIVSVEIAPPTASIPVAGTTQFTATPKDKDGNVVLVLASNIHWTSGTTAVATVNPTDGNPTTVTGVTAGTSQITATETESSVTSATPATVTVTAVVGCTPGPVTGPGGLANSAWPRQGHDNFNSFRGTGSGATGVQKWAITTGQGSPSVPVLGPDGTLYFGSTVDHKVNAINSSDGTVKWQFTADGAVVGSPVLGANGILYIGTATRFYALVASNGSSLWAKPLENAYSPTLGADGSVYVSSFTSQQVLVRLNGSTGAQFWARSFGSQFAGSNEAPAIGVNGTVYFSAQDGKVYALDGNCGTTIWSFNVGLTAFSQPSLGTTGESAVYIHAADGSVIELDATTGAKNWQGTATGGVAPPAIGTNGTLYVLGNGGVVTALNPANGVTIWTHTPAQSQNTTGSGLAVSGDNRIYYASGGSFQNVFALDGATGNQVWNFQLPGSAQISTTSPIIDGAGVVYVRTSNDGIVYAIH